GGAPARAPEHIPPVDLSGASNAAGAAKNRRREGCAPFGLGLRCSSVTAPLPGDAPGARAEAPRASPQAKWGATNVTGFTLMTTKFSVGDMDNEWSIQHASGPTVPQSDAPASTRDCPRRPF